MQWRKEGREGKEGALWILMVPIKINDVGVKAGYKHYVHTYMGPEGKWKNRGRCPLIAFVRSKRKPINKSCLSVIFQLIKIKQSSDRMARVINRASEYSCLCCGLSPSISNCTDRLKSYILVLLSWSCNQFHAHNRGSLVPSCCSWYCKKEAKAATVRQLVSLTATTSRRIMSRCMQYVCFQLPTGLMPTQPDQKV